MFAQTTPARMPRIIRCASVVEEKLHRYSVGAELASLDGLSLTGYWLHRNVNGGGERLKIDGAISNIGAGTSGVDYALGVTLERPATFSPDATATLSFDIGHLDEVDYYADYADLGLSLRYYFSDQLTARAGIGYEYSEGRDPGGKFRFRVQYRSRGATLNLSVRGFSHQIVLSPRVLVCRAYEYLIRGSRTP